MQEQGRGAMVILKPDPNWKREKQGHKRGGREKLERAWVINEVPNEMFEHGYNKSTY